MGRGQRNRFGKRESVIAWPRIPAGWAEEFEYHGYHLDFTLRLEQRLFKDKFGEYAANRPHVDGGGICGCPE